LNKGTFEPDCEGSPAGNHRGHAMRRRKGSDSGSLDSLLDTMTNVVGILVILLTVTQLGVRDAVKRISTTESVKPEVLEKTQEELRQLEKLHARLFARLKALVEQGKADPSEELARVKKEILDYQADIEVLREKQEREKREAELAAKKALDEIKRLLEKHEKEANELLAKVNQRAEELARLRAQLADTPEQGPLPAKVVNLPNPRAAPEKTEPMMFICREGRIIPVDVEGLRERAQKRAEFIVLRRKLGRDPKAGIDGKVLAEEFNDKKIRDRYFELGMVVSGRYPRLVFERRKDAGETIELLEHASSRYQQQIRRVNRKNYYLRFLVWPDSFETYLAARKIASERGLLAGWQAMTTSGEYTTSLGGKIRCGPPPPPAPKPKPSQKPKPKPRKPPPTDMID